MDKRMLAIPATVPFTYPGAAGGSAINLTLADFPDHILIEAIRHGIQQKGADCVSDAKKRDLTESAAFAEVNASLDSMRAGTWAKKGGGAKIKNLAQYINREAVKLAKLRTETEGDRYFGKDATKLTALYVTSEAGAQKREVWSAEWDRIVAERATKESVKDDDLGDLLDDEE